MRPIDQSAKLVEARLPLGSCAKPKNFLPDPPMRHDALPKRDGPNGIMDMKQLQAPESICAQISKHFGTIGPRNGTGARETLPQGRGGSSNMDRPFIHRERRFAHRFGQRRMRVAGSGQILRGAAEFHQHAGFRDEFACPRADDVNA